MSTIKLSTASSGSISLTPADTASNLTLTVPAQAGSVVTADSSGNVGIGTSSPAYTLDISSSSGNVFRGTASSVSTALYVSGGIPSFGTTTNTAFRFITNDTERMRIDSSGNLLVGTTSTFGVGTTILPSGQVFVSRDGDVSGVFDRRSSDGQSVHFRRQGSTVGSVSVTTVLTTYNTTSDYRLKTVVAPVTDAGTRIDALEPIEYDWNNGGGRTRGFLAHQFAEIYPNSVSGEKDAVDKDGKPVYQGMQPSTPEVMADLIAEIQSLRKRVAQLESK